MKTEIYMVTENPMLSIKDTAILADHSPQIIGNVIKLNNSMFVEHPLKTHQMGRHHKILWSDYIEWSEYWFGPNGSLRGRFDFDTMVDAIKGLSSSSTATSKKRTRQKASKKPKDTPTSLVAPFPAITACEVAVLDDTENMENEDV